MVSRFCGFSGQQLNFAPEFPVLKQVQTFLFVFLILLQPLSRMGILALFSFQQAEIAKTSCVQRNVKGNTCQGRCQLKKQLKKVKDTEKRSGVSENPVEEFQWSSPIQVSLPACLGLEQPIQWHPLQVPSVLDGFSIIQPQPPSFQFS